MLLTIKEMMPDDYVGFTFFIGYMAMAAATFFFIFERNSVSKKWKMSLLVSALITGIAAVHYGYMREYYLAFETSPTFFRYVDWILTVPLMCVEFYLLTRIAGATKSLLWRLIIASTWMLVAGYIGEAMSDGTTGHSVMWGVISTLGYLYILYHAWFGEIAQLAANSKSETVKKGVKAVGNAATSVAKAAPGAAAVAGGLGAGVLAKKVTDKVMGHGVKEDYGTPIKDQTDTEIGDVCFDAGAALPATIKAIGDPREIPTSINLIKNKWRAQGLKPMAPMDETK